MSVQEILNKLPSLNKEFEDVSPQEILYHFINEYKDRIAFATSLGTEDQVLIHMITSINPDVKIFTLDTGRLFPETYDLIDKTNSRFKIKIDVYFPDTQEVESMVKEKGVNLFYSSVENRKLCCNIRKIEPIKRALKGIDVWISGLRSLQSITRKDAKLIEWDDNYNLIKISPLINWTEQQVWDHIHDYNIPYNTLHDKGYPSIGCQPCTRAISPGEDIRSGRWWWEHPELKECGLHKK